MTVWQPYGLDEDPLFTSDLLHGYPAIPPSHLQRLIAYLEAVAARRHLLHPHVAFNAIYFGYDLDYGGYPGGPVDFNRFPTPGGANVPVGSMINAGTEQTPLYAEVLYKEGAHPAVGADGQVPTWLSGAPAAATDPHQASPGVDGPHDQLPVDRLVADFDAFGAGLSLSPQHYDRLRRRQHLDPLGHLIVPSGDACDDYAAFLVGPGRPSLIGGPLPLLLDDSADDTDLRTGVEVALQVLDAVLSVCPNLDRWGPYAFPRAELAMRMADQGPLGGGDIAVIAASLQRPPDHRANRRWQTSPESVAYTAIGPRARTYARHSAPLTGIGYATAVCHINAAIADQIRSAEGQRERAHPPVQVRIDDLGQAGGIWRTAHPPGRYASIDPLQPLGLGWLESLPPAVAPAKPAQGELNLAGGLAPELDADPPLTITDSQISWSAPLRLRHSVTGMMPLPAQVKDLIAAGPIRLRLTHDGETLDDDEADQYVSVDAASTGLQLTGVVWPLAYFPGIILDFWWPRDAPTLNASSTLLSAPEFVNGQLLTHRYDLDARTRDGSSVDDTTPSAAPPGVAARIVTTIRQRGLLQPGGAAALPEALLTKILTGQGHPGTLLTQAVTELLAAGILIRHDATRSTTGSFTFPAQGDGPTESVLVWTPTVTAARSPASPDDLGCAPRQLPLQERDISPYLRRLAPDTSASEDARAEYRRIHERFGYGAELPAGYTLVRGYSRRQ